MNIEVHFGGYFKNVQGVKTYVGGICKEIQDFDTDTMSWFELRYMLKQFGIISNYKVHCLRPKESLDSGLEAVYSDQCVLRILNYMDLEQNVVLYIEHLVEGVEKELLPAYCLREKDDPINVMPKALGGDGQKTCASTAAPLKSPKKLTTGRHAILKRIQDDILARTALRKKQATESAVLSPTEAVVTLPTEAAATLPTEAAATLPTEAAATLPTEAAATLPTEAAATLPTEAAATTLLKAAVLSPTEALTATKDDVLSPKSVVLSPKESAATSPTEAAATTPTKAAILSPTEALTATKAVVLTPPATTPTKASVLSPTETVCTLRRSPRFLKKSTCVEHSWKVFMQEVEKEFTELSDKNMHEAEENKLPDKEGDHEAEEYNLSDKEGEGDNEADENSLPEKDSDYAPTDSLQSQQASEGEGETSIPKYSQFSMERDLKKVDLEVGMQFESPQHFRTALRHQAIKIGFDLFWQKNSGTKISVKCKAEGCPFRVYCSWNTDKTRYCVKTLIPEHTCGRALSNTQVTRRWLAKEYMEHFRSDPNMKWTVFKDLVQREVGVSISQFTCYRVRRLALEELEGKNHVQFHKLWDYAQVLLKHNPGSYVKVKTKSVENDPDHVQFQAFFVSFAAMLKGLLNGCRPVIGMDGCHLTSSCGGILLSAVSRDPNNQMYPVAYAVVEVENKETWSWFITTLLEALGVANVQGWTFICDRQKGLVESLKLLVPRADVRFCVRHLYSNFKDKFKGMRLKKLLWRAAASYTVEGHDEAMNEIKATRIEAFDYLNSIEKHLWARSYFSTYPKCDLLVNNICESFNKFILEAREKPILTMLEMVRRLLMRRFENKRQSSESITSLGGKIREKLKEMAKESNQCTPYAAEPGLFQVVEKNNQVIINLKEHTCTCKQWMMTGIPCKHAMSCIQYLRLKPEDFVHEYYSKERYIAAYKDVIYPIPDQSSWEKQDFLKILPLAVRKQPGRPKKARKRAEDEPKKKQHMSRSGQLIRCSRCKELGHNNRTCKSTEVRIVPAKNTAPMKRGRPKASSSAAIVQ